MRPTIVYDQMSVANFGMVSTASVNSAPTVSAIGRGSPGSRASRRERSIDTTVASRMSVTFTAGAIDLGAMITTAVHAAAAIACGQRRGRVVESGGRGSTANCCATVLLVPRRHCATRSVKA